MDNTYKKRIDELGRIVIPKQIRDNIKINSYDELEIFIKDNFIILKKSCGLNNYKEKLDKFMLLIKEFINFDIIISFKNKIISSTVSFFKYNDDFILSSSNFIEVNEVKYNVIKNNIIIDSINVGDIYFLMRSLNIDKKVFKDIIQLIIELIN